MGKRLVRVQKPGGGYALGRKGGKLITDADGAPCCCGDDPPPPTGDCCYGVFTGVLEPEVNGGFFGDATPINLGGRPIYRETFFQNSAAQIKNLNGQAGVDKGLITNTTISAGYQRNGQPGACISDALIESSSSGFIHIFDTTQGLARTITPRVDTSVVDLGKFDSHIFGGFGVPLTFQPPGTHELLIGIRVPWSGTIGGTTLAPAGGSGLWPVRTPATNPVANGNAASGNYAQWLTDGLVEKVMFNINYRGPGATSGTTIDFDPYVTTINGYTLTETPTAQVSYSYAPRSVSMSIDIRANTTKAWGGGVTESHTTHIHQTHTAEFEVNGSCIPESARGGPLPPGLDEFGQPLKQPGQCAGCGQ